MSYTNASHLSDADIEAVIAYLRTRPAEGASAVDPPDTFNLLGLILLGAGVLPTGAPVVSGAVEAPPKGPSARYGAYVLSYQDCRACHGPALTGGVPGQIGPLAPDLELVKAWSPEQFATTMRTGVDPGGHRISSLMPWQAIGRMDDEELRAIYEYLQRLPEGSEPLQAGRGAAEPGAYRGPSF
jgi:mono/diheme cytochrome c family protein